MTTNDKPREWEIACEEMECQVYGPSTDGESVVVVEKSALEASQAKVKELEWFTSQMNKYVLAGETDTQDSAIKVFKELNDKVRELEQQCYMLIREFKKAATRHNMDCEYGTCVAFCPVKILNEALSNYKASKVTNE